MPPTFALPGAHESLAAVRRTAAGSSWSPASTPPTPGPARRRPRGSTSTHGQGEVWGLGKAAVLRRARRVVYVGDHVHDVEGALAAGSSASRCSRAGCTPDELLEAGTHVVLATSQRSPPGSTSTSSVSAGGARGAAARARIGAGRVQRRRRQRVPARGRRPRARRRRRGRRDRATPTRCPHRERARPLPSRESLGVRLLTPATHELEREGYRANAGDRCYFCKAELLDVLGPLAAEHGSPPSRPGPTPTTRGRLPTRDPRRRRARRGHAACRRRADQGPGAGRLPRMGPADLGQAGCGLPVLAGSPTGSRSPLPGWPGSSGPRRRCGRRWPAPASRSATCGCATSATGPGRGGRRAARGGRAHALGRRAERVDAGFAAAEVDPRGFRSGSMNERLADPERYR